MKTTVKVQLEMARLHARQGRPKVNPSDPGNEQDCEDLPRTVHSRFVLRDRKTGVRG